MKIITALEAVKTRRFTIEHILDRVEYICIRTSDAPSGRIISREARRELFILYPEQNRIIINDDGMIIGYWFFVTLNQEHFKLAREKMLIEQNITRMSTRLPGVGLNNIYIINIGILPEYHGYCDGGGKLLESFITQIESFAERGIFFNEWITNARTDYGHKYSSMFGLQPIGQHKINKVTVYFGAVTGNLMTSMLNRHAFMKKFPRLIAYYKDRFSRR